MAKEKPSAEENVRAQEDNNEEETRPTREYIDSYDPTKIAGWSTGDDPGDSSRDHPWWHGSEGAGVDQPPLVQRRVLLVVPAS